MTLSMYRAMEPDSDGTPKVGTARNMLGVRPAIDMRGAPKDVEGRVLAGPGRGGLSVNVDDWTGMPAPIRPKEFGGHNSLTTMYVAASSCLEPHQLSLTEVVARSTHATIEAANECTLDAFQGRIASTRTSWSQAAAPALSGSGK